MRRTLLYSLLAIAGLTAALGARQMPSSPVYAIRGARLVTAAGATIDKGNLVMRTGLIVDVGPNAALPDDAGVVEGAETIERGGTGAGVKRGPSGKGIDERGCHECHE